ncbi:hypothetical protein GCM10010405_14990 [Streptomyces macrosporus]|uniref:Uncharacterized protein n=1 Tax=Streptomyces macrosporus TaxID=44032 RepID=A0ABP5WS46_9ACTN
MDPRGPPAAPSYADPWVPTVSAVASAVASGAPCGPAVTAPARTSPPTATIAATAASAIGRRRPLGRRHCTAMLLIRSCLGPVGNVDKEHASDSDSGETPVPGARSGTYASLKAGLRNR